MRADAPAELVDLLTRLGIATADDLQRLQSRVRKRAGELPLLTSLWIDALQQLRRITPYQAAEILTGRGEGLAVGEYLIESRLATVGLAECFRARHKESRNRVVLLVAEVRAANHEAVVERLCAHRDRWEAFSDERVVIAGGVGTSDQAVWLTLPHFDGVPLRLIVQRTGRLPAEAVFEIARRLAALLSQLEIRSLCYGDISADSIWLDDRGEIRLLATGLGDALCRDVAARSAEVPAEAFENIPPERAAGRATASIPGDKFACGTLWWHLLAGRPAISGATGLGKLRAIRQGKIEDVRRFASDTPAALAQAIADCTASDVECRPASFTALAEQLGPSTATGRSSLQKLPLAARNRRSPLAAASPTRKPLGAWSATIAACLTAVLLVTWPLWHRPRGESAVHPNRTAPQLSTERQSATVKANRESHAVERASPQPISIVADGQDRQRRVERAAFHEPTYQPQPLVLPGQQLAVSSRYLSSLQACQLVRGRPGERPLLLVPPEGLDIHADGVRLEDIDFVWRPSFDAALDPERTAFIDLRASGICFKNCTFQAVTSPNGPRPTTIRWTGPRRSSPLSAAGHVQFTGCVFSGVAAAIERDAAAPLGIEITDTLYVDSGPMLRLKETVRADEPIDFSLSHSTIRASAALVGLSTSRLSSEEPGLITIAANNCVFVPARSGALVLIDSVASAQLVAKSILCSGAGSILGEGSAVVRRIGANSEQRPAKEIDLPIDGVVSTRIEFVGPTGAGSSASRVSRWMAPTQSADPPGIAEGLPNLPQMDGQ